MNRRRGAGLALVAVVAVFAVVAAPVSAATVRAREPSCSLLRGSEVERVLGSPVMRTLPADSPVGASLCYWTVDGSGDARFVAVYLARGDKDEMRRGYAMARATYRGAARERVTGLGKRAFYAVPIGAVYMLREGRLVYVQNLDGRGTEDPVAIREQAVELAGLVADRL
ncbi:MAG: hypothetical protein WEC34_07395 [Acidimicrobiia bacterium]